MRISELCSFSFAAVVEVRYCKAWTVNESLMLEYDKVGVSPGEAPPATTAKVNKEKRREGKNITTTSSKFVFLPQGKKHHITITRTIRGRKEKEGGARGRGGTTG